MRTKYECDYCGSDFDDKDECKEHEPLCHDNPASRSCETCVHHGTDVADTGKVWNTCSVGLLEALRWIDNHATACPGWSGRWVALPELAVGDTVQALCRMINTTRPDVEKGEVFTVGPADVEWVNRVKALFKLVKEKE